MELKRYVLLNNSMIYDLVVERDVEKFNMVKNGNQRAYGIKKTSDNILDLVEVGDLIEIPQTIIKVDNVNNNGSFETLVSREYSKVTAIYKCQPNGDYKKYEVK